MSEFYVDAFRRGNNILYSVYVNGRKFYRKESFNPITFMRSNLPPDKRSGWTNLKGEPVEPTVHNSIGDHYNWSKAYQGIMNAELYGFENHVCSFLSMKFPGEIKWDFGLLDIAYLDIETDSANGFPNIEIADKEINAITVKVNNLYYAFGLGEYVPHRDDVRYLRFSTEKELLVGFLDFWSRIKPDIVTGWNIEGFDIPYLVRRIKQVLGDPAVGRLSPFNLVVKREIRLNDDDILETFQIVGVVCLDYLALYKKYSGHEQESYRLDYIAHVELKERKLNYSDYGSLHGLYIQNHQKFMEYNIRDVELVYRLEVKRNLLRLALSIAYSAKMAVCDCFMTTRVWDGIIYNWLSERNIVVPMKKFGTKGSQFAGAYVKEPIPGMYKWIITLDVTSMYPSLFLHYNIGPDTYVRKVNLDFDTLVREEDHGHLPMLQRDNLSMAANGTLYRKDIRSFMCDMIEVFFNDRQKYKKLMLESKKKKDDMSLTEAERSKAEADTIIFDTMQQTKKVLLNGLYGATGTPSFRFFELFQAEAITISGQFTILLAEKKLNEFMNRLLGTQGESYVVYADTDSCSLCCDKLVEKVCGGWETEKIVDFLDLFASKKVQPFLDKVFSNMKDYMNAYDQKIFMKREKIAERALWTKKKRYVMSVWDNEGKRYRTPDLSVTGLESVRSSTPEACRGFLKDAFEVIMQGSEKATQAFIDSVRQEYDQLPVEEIAGTTAANDLEKYTSHDPGKIYGFKTPGHIKAALLYNYMLHKTGLENKYEKIKSRDKIKQVYLKEPNPLGDDVIGFLNVLPKEFGLDEYVDRQRQFEGTFLSPLKTIFGVLEWQTEERATIEDLFS